MTLVQINNLNFSREIGFLIIVFFFFPFLFCFVFFFNENSQNAHIIFQKDVNNFEIEHKTC